MLLALTLCLSPALLWSAQASFQPEAPPLASAPQTSEQRAISLATTRVALSAPILWAEANNKLDRPGLDVRLQFAVSGREALDLLINGEIDFATAADTPIVMELLQGARLRVLTTLAQTPGGLAFVGRRSRGITRVGDIRGKTIAVPPGTNAEYFLDSLLLYNEIDRRTVQPMYVAPDLLLDAVRFQVADGVAIWQPYADQILNALGDDAFLLTSSDIYTFTWNLVTREEIVQTDAPACRLLLRSLADATQAWNQTTPPVRDKFLANIHSIATATDHLQKIDWRLRLDQAFILSLEAQARWAIRSRKTDAVAVPNFLEYLSTTSLEAVDPNAIGLIR